jgi:tetratricopeptide (TPR) repeat protein/DNA-binding CsgD family transcriptional regulator
MPETIQSTHSEHDKLLKNAEELLKTEPQRAFEMAEVAGQRFGESVRGDVIKLCAASRQNAYTYVLEHAPELLKVTENQRELQFDVYSRYAASLLNTGRHEEALDAFLKTAGLISDQNSFEYARTILGAGFACFELGRYIEALHYCDICDAILLKTESDDGNTLVSSCMLRGKTQFSLGNYADATQHCLKAIEIEEKFGRTINTVNIYGNISVFAHVSGDYEKSLEWSGKALKKLDEPGAASEALIFCNLGNTYIKLDDYPKALENFERGYAISLNHNEVNTAATALHGIARVYEKDTPQKAIDYYQKALELREKAGIPFKKCVTLISLADVLREQGNYTEAHEHLMESLKIAEKIQAKQLLFEAHRCLAAMYKAQEQWLAAYSHLELAQHFEKLIQTEESANKTKVMILRFEQQQAAKEAEILRLQKEKLEEEALFNKVQLEELTTDIIQKNQLLSQLRQNGIDAMGQSGLKQKTTLQMLVNAAEKGVTSFWQQFEEKLRTIQGDLADKVLKFAPDLTPVELRILLLLKTGVSNKEISQILFIGERTIEYHRTSLRKKLNIDRSDNLVSFLNSL